jgi:hypothetical protein
MNAALLKRDSAFGHHALSFGSLDLTFVYNAATGSQDGHFHPQQHRRLGRKPFKWQKCYAQE